MNCLLVPTLGDDLTLLNRLADSIDSPIDYKAIILNNERWGLEEWRASHPDWVVFNKGHNLGVAASWNLAPETYHKNDAWLIVNDDFVFQPGQLEKLCKLADANAGKFHTAHLTETEGYNCFVWTRKAVREIGLFDENFFPAYYEDYDYRLRLRLAGGISINCGYEDSEIVHGKPYSGGARYRRFLDAIDVYAREYFIRKWDAVSDSPTSLTFTSPFNDRLLPLSHWELEQERHDELREMWNEFINVENPITHE